MLYLKHFILSVRGRYNEIVKLKPREKRNSKKYFLIVSGREPQMH